MTMPNADLNALALLREILTWEESDMLIEDLFDQTVPRIRALTTAATRLSEEPIGRAARLVVEGWKSGRIKAVDDGEDKPEGDMVLGCLSDALIATAPLTDSQKALLARLREQDDPTEWLLLRNAGFSMGDAHALLDRDLIETSMQLAMPAARLKPRLATTPPSATPSAGGEKCPGDGGNCYVGNQPDDMHYRCGTVQCGRIENKAALPPVTDEVRAPDGWKLVPVEPTREMLLAAYDRSRDGTTPLHFKTWASMLSASPEPPRDETAAPDSGERE